MVTKEFPKAKNVVKKRCGKGHRYLYHGKDITGKDVYETIQVTDRSSTKDYFAEIEKAKIKLEMRNNQNSIARFVLKWHSVCQHSKGTIKCYDITLHGFSLDNEHNEQLVNDLIQSDLKQSTIHVRVNTIRNFFRWLMLTGDVPYIKDPTRNHRVKALHEPRRRVATNYELQRLIEEIRKRYHDEDMLYLLLLIHTGARVSSIEALTPSDFRDGCLYFTNVKRKRRYFYPIPLRNEETVALWYKLTANGTLWHTSGKILRERLYRRMVALFPPDGNGELLTPHSLRHTYATRAIQNGVSPEILARLLDHVNISTTLSVYARHSDNQLANAVDAVEAALK